MTFIPTSNQHQSPQSSLPPLSQKQLNTGTWGGGGNTCVITDPYFTANSFAVVQVTGTIPAAGNWSYVYAEGTLTITSNNSESSTLPLAYVIY